ncbi:MAG: hypothetical protein KDD11_23410, partial [Acidobacteria bacterium]|nr:hypothetical protein [Acidobacteriota bacterium]
MPVTLALLAVGWIAGSAEAQVSTSGSYVLSQATGGGAGASSTSSSYVLDGTLSQESTVGRATSTDFVLESGFWTSG